MNRTTLLLVMALMLAILDGGNVSPSLAQTESVCLALEVTGASGRIVCEETTFGGWTWTAPATGLVTFDTRGSDMALELTVYALDPLFAEVASAADEVRFTAREGVKYTIFASADGEASAGTIVLNWRPSSSDGGSSSASNDDFGASMEISGASGQSTGGNAGAGKESGEPHHADDSGGASVWWTWTTPVTGPVTFDTRGSTFDTLLAVYTGDSLNDLTEIASNDDALAGDVLFEQSEVRFSAQQGQTYHLAVDGYDGATGTVVLNWQLAPVSGTFIASVEVDIPGPGGLIAVGRDITWIAPAPEVDGLTKGWHYNRNSNGNLHGLQINVGHTEIVAEQWLDGERQGTASYRDGDPFGEFASYADGELEGIQYDVREDDWSFETYRDGMPHGPFGSYLDGEPEGDFGTVSNGELEGMLHTIGGEGWAYEVYEDGTRHGPYGTYTADGQKDGPFGIFMDGRKNPGEVHWTNGEREPGAQNRPPIAKPGNVPREITFNAQTAEFGFTRWSPEGGHSRMYDSLNPHVNMFFWEPDGDTLEYFVSSEPPGIFHTTSNGKVPSALLELDESATPGTSGYAWLRACDPEGLCALVEFHVFVQPEVTPKDPGEFTVEAPYCKQTENPPAPLHELEICARDLEYEDGDFLYMTIDAHPDNYRGPALSFPLSNSPTCKTVKLRGSKAYGGSVTYDFGLDAQSMRGGLFDWPWWNWDTDQPLCEVGQTPDCFVGPRLWGHPGIEENRGELIVRTSIDTETHEWRYTPVTPTVMYEQPVLIPRGQITLITQEACTDMTLDEQADLEAELEEAMRKAEEASRLAEQAARELDGAGAIDGSTDGRPILIKPLPDLEGPVDSSRTIDLSQHFESTDDGRLTYGTTSNESPDVASAQVSGSTLTLQARQAGTTTIRVTAWHFTSGTSIADTMQIQVTGPSDDSPTGSSDDDTPARSTSQPAGESEGFKLTTLSYGVGFFRKSDVGKLYTCSEYIVESQERVIRVLGTLPPVSPDVKPGDNYRHEHRLDHVCPGGYVGACTYRGGRWFGGRTVGYEKWHAYQEALHTPTSLSYYQQGCKEDGGQWHGSN